jgi:hypothetical protein
MEELAGRVQRRVIACFLHLLMSLARTAARLITALSLHHPPRHRAHALHPRACLQVWWTWEVEDAFRQVKAGAKRAMKELEGKLSRQLNEMVALVREPLKPHTRRKVSGQRARVCERCATSAAHWGDEACVRSAHWRNCSQMMRMHCIAAHPRMRVLLQVHV